MMARIIGIGHQDFTELIASGCFYVDKTEFIREWWENQDVVTLIARPRRFGKTLNMSMLERFFSVEYKGQGEIFEGLSIWKDKTFQELQGTYPVIALSFADVKEVTFPTAREKICQIIKMVFGRYRFLLDSDVLGEDEKEDFRKISADPGNSTITLSLKMLSLYLFRYYGKKVIILLDEYDTPMQEAYVNGYWDEVENMSDTRVVIDMAGEAIEIPNEVYSYVDSWAAHATIDLLLDHQKGMVATAVPRNPKESWVYAIAENLEKAESLEFSENMNLEKIIALDPDVVFGKSENYREMFENVGIPYINVGFYSYDTMVQSIQLVAEVLGEDAVERADKYVDYLYERIDWVRDKLSSLKDEDKLSIVHGYPMYELSVDGSRTIIDEWINYSGAINAAADIAGEIVTISLEQLFLWNPDVIISGYGQGDIESIMTDPAWSNLTAVKNKMVYINPKGIFMWDRNGIEEALQIQWCASMLYPELFEDFDIREEVKYFYKEFLDYELSDYQVEKFINHENP
jgi:iron complex transport system substrate-binding protein